MKKVSIASVLFLLVFTACDFLFDTTTDDNDDNDSTKKKGLYVRFENNEISPCTITGIYTLNMGVAGELPEPNGEYGENVLGDSVTVAPGEFVFFTLDIPNLHFAYCQLAVEKDGQVFRLSDQEGYTNTSDGTFTHWGSDERTVTASLRYNEELDRVSVSGWMEFAGIEE